MRFGLDLPPQFRVFGGFYSFCMESLPPLAFTFVFAGALGRRPVAHEVPA